MYSKQEKDRPPPDKPCLEQVSDPVFYLPMTCDDLHKPASQPEIITNTRIKWRCFLLGLKAQSKTFTGCNLLWKHGRKGTEITCGRFNWHKILQSCALFFIDQLIQMQFYCSDTLAGSSNKKYFNVFKKCYCTCIKKYMAVRGLHKKTGIGVDLAMWQLSLLCSANKVILLAG